MTDPPIADAKVAREAIDDELGELKPVDHRRARVERLVRARLARARVDRLGDRRM